MIRKTNIIDLEVYDYDFIKAVTISRTESVKFAQPFCIIIEKGGVLIHIIPFFLRQRKFTPFNKVKYLSTFPTILTLRHHFLLGEKRSDVDYIDMFHEVFKCFKKNKLDIIQLNGLENKLTQEFSFYCKNNSFFYRKIRIKELEGTKQSDFFGFELLSEWEEFISGFNRKFLKEYKRHLKNIQQLGEMRFSRYSKGKFYGDGQKEIKELLNDIHDVDD